MKKINNILSRFVYRYKLKKALKYNYNKDLCGTELSLFPEKQKIRNENRIDKTSQNSGGVSDFFGP